MDTTYTQITTGLLTEIVKQLSTLNWLILLAYTGFLYHFKEEVKQSRKKMLKLPIIVGMVCGFLEFFKAPIPKNWFMFIANLTESMFVYSGIGGLFYILLRPWIHWGTKLKGPSGG